MTDNLKFIIVVVVLLVASFVGGYFTAINQIKGEFLDKVDHLETTLMSKDSLINEYKVAVTDMVNSQILVRDTLEARIKDLINDKSSRIIYRNPKISTATGDEILDRINNFLDDPEKY